MTYALGIDPARSALIVLDYQTDVLDKFMPPAVSAPALARLPALLEAARASGMRVIHVVTAFRPGYPEVSARNAVFAGVKELGLLGRDADGTQIAPAGAPRDQEPVVTKPRVSAFHATELETILRAGGIETLLLAGVHTSGAVLSTLRQAVDLDYRLVVVKDCCADPDPAVHAILLDVIMPPHAAILESGAIVAALRRPIADRYH